MYTEHKLTGKHEPDQWKQELPKVLKKTAIQGTFNSYTANALNIW